MKPCKKLTSFIKITKILKNNIKYLRLDIVILILLGCGLMRKLKEKLLEVGRHNLNLWIINSIKIILNSQLQVQLITGGLKNIILMFLKELKKLFNKINLNLLEVLGLNLMAICHQENLWQGNFYMGNSTS